MSAPDSAVPPDAEENITSEDLEQALQVAATQYRELNEQLKRRRLLRDSNIKVDRPDETALKKLDSSVKRNAALVKKLRQLSEDAKDSLLEEIRRTNQSKYVTEAKSAISEANLRSKDISAAVQVASLLHQTYAEFGTELASALAQNLLSGSTTASDAERPTISKRRGWLRLLAELNAMGVGGSSRTILSIVRQIANASTDADRDSVNAALGILAGFAKAGREEYLGLPRQLPRIPETPRSSSEIPAVQEAATQLAMLQDEYTREASAAFCASRSEQAEMQQAVTESFEAGCSELVRENAALLETEQQNLRALNNRGELPEEMAAKYESQRKALDALQKVLASLGEAIDRKLPVLEVSNTTRLKGSGIVEVVSGRETGGNIGPWDDEESRAFYESLPDVQALIPAVLLNKGKDAKQESNALPSPEEPGSPREPGNTNAEAPGEKPSEDEGKEGAKAEASESVAGGATETSSSEIRAEVEAAIHHILRCSSKEGADEAALSFCYVNSKAARRRLARLLTGDSRPALHQTPFFARVVATLGQAFPDFSSQVLKALEDDFSRLLARKDSQLRLVEERLCNAHFLAELTKFRVCPYGAYFTMLKALLDDFSGHNIDTAAALVEPAGRFLLLLQETHQRMENMLEVMMKLKNSKNVDARQGLAVDSAYLACKPPERAALQRNRRPPQELYMRHLIFETLSHENLEQVVKKLRKFSWAETEPRLVDCILSAVKGRFAEIAMLASVAANLSKYHPSLGVALADALLEEIRMALMMPDSGKYQRRIGQMRLLGELYNYRLMDSRTIFETLYLMLAAGHSSSEEMEQLDPPTNFFRIRLICVLLMTCGQYFSKGGAGQRLDRFLMYFQRYILYKPPLPLDVDFDVQDMLSQFRPRLRRFESFEEASKAVEALEVGETATSPADEPTPDDSENESRDSNAGELDEDLEASGDKLQGATALDEEDEEVRFLRPGDSAPQEIDEEFEKELAALQGPPAVSGQSQLLATSRSSSSPTEAGATVAFKVMLRKGGKDDRTRAIQIPAGLALAVKSKEDLAADAAERAEMKRLVLQASQHEHDMMEAGEVTEKPGEAHSSGRGTGHRGHGYYNRGRAQPSRGLSRGDMGDGRKRGAVGRGRGRRYSGSQLSSVEESS